MFCGKLAVKIIEKYEKISQLFTKVIGTREPVLHPSTLCNFSMDLLNQGHTITIDLLSVAPLASMKSQANVCPSQRT